MLNVEFGNFIFIDLAFWTSNTLGQEARNPKGSNLNRGNAEPEGFQFE